MTPRTIDDIADTISEKDLRLSANCHYSHYLHSEIGMTRIPKSAAYALKMLFLQQRKKMFDVNDSNTRRFMDPERRAGPDLKHVEQMDREELSKYLKFKSLGDLLRGAWFRTMDDNKIHNSTVAWYYEKQKGPSGQLLKEAGEAYHEFVLEHGPPVMGFIDFEPTFFYGNIALKIRLPEIRQGMFIDDPGLFNFKGNIDTKSLITLRILGYCTLVHERPLLRLKWGIPDHKADKWGGNEMYIDPDVTYRYLNLRTGRILTTHRSDDDLPELMETVQDFIDNRTNYTPESTKVACGRCSYNIIGVNGEVICRHAHEKTNPAKPIEFYQ